MYKKLKERKMSVGKLVVATGNLITNASIFRWMNGTSIATDDKLHLVCKALSNLPIIEEGKPPRYERVSLQEFREWADRH
jgi:hypothetical protein